MQVHRPPLAELLLEARLINQETLDALDASQRDDERRLRALLVERKLVSPARLAQVVSHQLSLPWVSLEKVEFKRDLLKLLPKKMAYRLHVIPVYLRGTVEEGTLYVATDDPTRDEVLTACSEACGLRVRFMVAAPDDVRRAIETHYGRRSSMVMSAVGVSIVGAPGLPGPESRRRPPPPPPPSVGARPQSPSQPEIAITVAEDEVLDEILAEDENEEDDVSERLPPTTRGDAIAAEPAPADERTPEERMAEDARATPLPDERVTFEPPFVEPPAPFVEPPEAPPPRSGLAARIDELMEETWAGELDDEFLYEPRLPQELRESPLLPPVVEDREPVGEPRIDPTPPSPPTEAAPSARRRPPVVLLVAPPVGFVETCAALALSLPARVEAVTLAEANVRALATEPIVIVVTDEVYEFDRLAFNQLAMAVGAPLVVWSADLDPEDLEPVLTMAYRAARR